MVSVLLLTTVEDVIPKSGKPEPFRCISTGSFAVAFALFALLSSGRLFSKAHSRKKRRHMDHRTDTSKALRMFLDTITALQAANDQGQDALEVLDQKIGWYRLLRMKPELAAMVEVNEASPLVPATE